MLKPWLSDNDCLKLTINPLGAGDRQPAQPQLTNHETIAELHLAVCEPLLRAGSNNEGPSLPGAEVSYIGAADFALFFESRFHLALLWDLERLYREHQFNHIELVTDLIDGGRYNETVGAFAYCHKLTCRHVTVKTPRLSIVRTLSRAGDLLADQIHPNGSAYTDYFRALVRRRMFAFNSRDGGKHALSRSRLVAQKGRLRIAMLFYHPKSGRYLLPIRDRLLETGHDALLISPRPETAKVLQAAGVPFISLRRVLPRARFLRDVERYMDSFPLVNQELGEQVSGALDGAIRRVFKRQALSMMPIYADLAAQLPAILANEGINVVLGTDSGSVAGRCLFRTAERMAIPTVFIQHGAFVQAHAVAHYFTDARLLVWGVSSRDTLVRSGVSQPERINCIGSAFEEEALAQALNQSNASTPEASQQAAMVLVTFGVPGNLVAEGPFLKAATEVIQAAEQLPHVQFVIKPHPGDNTKLWETNTAEQGLPNVTIRRDADTYALMRSCRVLVTMLSTTGAEAICLGKPVISVNLDHLPSGLDYIEFGAAYRIDQPRTLAALLRSLIEVPRDTDRLAEVRRSFAKQFLHREERPAAERIVNYLECLAMGNALAKPVCAKS